MSKYEVMALVISVASLVLSFIAIYIGYEKNKKLNNREVQRKIYKIFLEIKEEIIKEPKILFDIKFLDKMNKLKIDFELNASEKVYNEYKILLETFYKRYALYINYYDSIDPFSDNNMFYEEVEDENGDIVNIQCIKDSSLMDGKADILAEKYKSEHSYSSKEIEDSFSKIIKNMKNDLK